MSRRSKIRLCFVAMIIIIFGQLCITVHLFNTGEHGQAMFGSAITGFGVGLSVAALHDWF